MRIQFALEALALGNKPLYSAWARHHAALAVDRSTAVLASSHDKRRLAHRAEWMKAG